MAAPQKITDDQLTDDLASGLNQSEIAAKYGMSKTAVHYRMKKKGNKKNILPPARTKNNPPQRKSRTQISAKPAKNTDSVLKQSIYQEAKDGQSLNAIAEKHSMTTIDVAKIIIQQGPGPNSVGRPKAFNSPEEVQTQIDDYFNHCSNSLIIKQVVQKGEIILVPTPTPPTMAGLSLWLGIDRKTLNNYKNDKPFFPVIMRARKKIEENNMAMGLTGIYESRINTLNLASNFGYANKQEISGPDGGPVPMTFFPAEPKTISEWEKQVIDADVQKRLLPEVTGAGNMDATAGTTG